MTVRVWQRADGWTEVEGPGLMRRFDRPEEAEAFDPPCPGLLAIEEAAKP